MCLLLIWFVLWKALILGKRGAKSEISDPLSFLFFLYFPCPFICCIYNKIYSLDYLLPVEITLNFLLHYHSFLYSDIHPVFLLSFDSTPSVFYSSVRTIYHIPHFFYRITTPLLIVTFLSFHVLYSHSICSDLWLCSP